MKPKRMQKSKDSRWFSSYYCSEQKNERGGGGGRAVETLIGCMFSEFNPHWCLLLFRAHTPSHCACSPRPNKRQVAFETRSPSKPPVMSHTIHTTPSRGIFYWASEIPRVINMHTWERHKMSHTQMESIQSLWAAECRRTKDIQTSLWCSTHTHTCISLMVNAAFQ